MTAPRDSEPRRELVPQGVVQPRIVEGGVSVGFTPEALIRRVNNALEKFHLTGIQGEVFGYMFILSLYYQTRDGFILQSPPVKKNPWDSDQEFIPDIRAQVSMPNEITPDGQIVWMDRSTIWSSGYDEIINGQKISKILDVLLSGIERNSQSQGGFEASLESGISLVSPRSSGR